MTLLWRLVKFTFIFVADKKMISSPFKMNIKKKIKKVQELWGGKEK